MTPADTVLNKYVVITPARDEEAHIGQILQSMDRQTCRPAEWIIVNDGSRDKTGQIIDDFALRRGWVRVLNRKDRGERLAGSGVIAAFYEGFRALSTRDWQYVVKLDADLSMEPDYFERCLNRFAMTPRLGIAGGSILTRRNGVEEVEAKGDPPFHVRGATKIYRRECWDAIGGILTETGWDSVDEVMANMRGWRTATLTDIKLVQLRPTGNAYGGWRDSVKNGKGSYVCGYHPLFMAARCARRLVQGRRVVSAAGLAYGFLVGHILLRGRRVNPSIVRYLRREQMRALLRKPSIYTEVLG
jgi:poly-beta-1,6-N-acetyl-D-glucosamine synthase